MIHPLCKRFLSQLSSCFFLRYLCLDQTAPYFMQIILLKYCSFLTFPDLYNILLSLEQEFKNNLPLNYEIFTDGSNMRVSLGGQMFTFNWACACVCMGSNYYGQRCTLMDSDSVHMMDIEEHRHWFPSTLKKPLFHHVVVQLETVRLNFINGSVLLCFAVSLFLHVQTCLFFSVRDKTISSPSPSLFYIILHQDSIDIRPLIQAWIAPLPCINITNND